MQLTKKHQITKKDSERGRNYKTVKNQQNGNSKSHLSVITLNMNGLNFLIKKAKNGLMDF